MLRKFGYGIWFGGVWFGLFCGQATYAIISAEEDGLLKTLGQETRCESPDEGEPPSPDRIDLRSPLNPLRGNRPSNAPFVLGAADGVQRSSEVANKSPDVSSKLTPVAIPSQPQSMTKVVKGPELADVPTSQAPALVRTEDTKPIAQSPLKPKEVAVVTERPAEKKVNRLVEKKAADKQESPDLNAKDPDGGSDKEDAETTIREMKEPTVDVGGKKPGPEKSKAPSNSRTTKSIASPLNAAQVKLQSRIENCLAYYLFRPESTIKRSPWAVMHALLPFGVETELTTGNQKTNAIGWMCFNGKCRTQRLFSPKGNGFTVAVGPGVQGHEGQFLAMLAQSYVPSGYPIRIEGKQFTIRDLVQYEMASCKEKSELTFKLIGLSHYLPSEQTWVANDNQVWSISKVVDEELNQTIVGAACGGTHRLMGLTYCVQRRSEEGLPINGNFLRAANFINDFVDYTWTLQNPDGSFSTNWFESRGDDPDLDRKVQTTGHILEWLVYSLPEENMDDPRIVRSVQFLLSQVWDRRDHEWAIGPRGHSLRALSLYDQKRFGAQLGEQRQRLANVVRHSQSRR